MTSRSASLRSRPLLAIAALWVFAWCWYTWGYWEDDAYIHLEYARSVAEGRGFAFNGRLSNGDTSPLWVLLLAAPLLAGMEGLLGGKLLALLGCAFALAMTWQFARRLADDALLRDPRWPAWVLLLFVASPYFCYWAFSGMEAVSAAGWVMLQSMLLMPRQASARTVLAAALCMGLGPLVRPELVLMFAAGGPFLLHQWWQVSRPVGAPRRWLLFAVALALLAMPLLLWSAYAVHAFGQVLPNTNAAKQAPPGTVVPLRLVQVMALGFPGVLLMAATLSLRALVHRAPPQGSPAADRAARCWHGLPHAALPLLAWLVMVSVFYAANHTHVQTRYVLVMAPGLMALLWVVAATRLRPPWLPGLTASCVALAMGASLWLTWPHLRNKIELIASTARMAEHIQATVPRQSPIAVYAIGQFGYLLRDHELVDVGGITRPAASRFLYDEPARVAWARAEGARYFIWGEPPEADALLVRAFSARQTGWHLNPAAYEQDAPLRLWQLRAPPAH